MMDESTQIISTVEQYAKAAMRADRATLAKVATEKLVRQFTLTLRVILKLAVLISPRRMQKLAPQNVTIESQDSERAVVAYSTSFGKRHRYERVVLLKESGHWKVDGKFA